MQPSVDIVFECLPLTAVGRLDVPLDASDEYRARHQRLNAALESHGAERVYFLYNARCIYRFANSEVDGMARFQFEGVVKTDAGDSLTEEVDLDVLLVSETCGGIPPQVQTWLAEQVHHCVAVEFDRFIAAGRLAAETDEQGQLERLSDLTGIEGMGV